MVLIVFFLLCGTAYSATSVLSKSVHNKVNYTIVRYDDGSWIELVNMKDDATAIATADKFAADNKAQNALESQPAKITVVQAVATIQAANAEDMAAVDKVSLSAVKAKVDAAVVAVVPNEEPVVEVKP